MDGGALARCRLDPHRAAGLADKAEHLAEPEAGSLADALGGEEGIEGAGGDFGRHAGAAVGHGDLDIAARLQFQGRGLRRREPRIGGGQHQPCRRPASRRAH